MLRLWATSCLFILLIPILLMGQSTERHDTDNIYIESDTVHSSKLLDDNISLPEFSIIEGLIPTDIYSESGTRERAEPRFRQLDTFNENIMLYSEGWSDPVTISAWSENQKATNITMGAISFS